MIILCVSSQAKLFMICVGSGIILGFVYDALRILRRLFHHDAVLMAAEDFLYWCASAVFIFMLLLCADNGKIRLFDILGIFLGMIIYFSSISSFIVSFFTRAIRLIFIKPVHFLVKKITKFSKYAVNKIMKIAVFFKRKFIRKKKKKQQQK